MKEYRVRILDDGYLVIDPDMGTETETFVKVIPFGELEAGIRPAKKTRPYPKGTRKRKAKAAPEEAAQA